MMSNIFQWLRPNKLRFSLSQVRAGSPFAIHLEPRTKNFSVLTPSKRWEKYQAKSNPFDYTDSNEVGIYSVAEGEKRQYFAVNLTDESESDIRNPAGESQDRGTGEDPGPEPITAELPLWILFLLTAFIILILEYYVWLKNR